MKIPAIKNLKTYIKSIFQNCKKGNSVEPALLHDIDLKKVSLERISKEDTFQKENYSKVLSGIENDSHKEVMTTLFLKKKPMDEETYAKISPERLQMMRAQLTPNFVKDAETLVTASKIIKMLFDDKYGENKYIFVSIGRSLSALANCLGFMGVKTKQIPLSGCGAPIWKIGGVLDKMTNQEGFKGYKNFLAKTLKPEADKRHVFCDYAITGQTLTIFESFLNHPKVKLGTEKDDFVKINEFLEDSIKNLDKEYLNFVKRFNKMLHCQRFDDYAEIKSLDFRSLKKLNLALNSKDLIQNKLMKFCFLDMFKTSKFKG